jgi:hypothetical protein
LKNTKLRVVKHNDIRGGLMNKLFELYGFTFMPEFSSEEASVFVIKQGVFDNAYVVAAGHSESVDNCIDGLKELGYAVKAIHPKSEEEVRKELFEGFFQKTRAKRRIVSEYEKYIDKVVKSYPANARNYHYVSAPFLVNGEEHNLSAVIDTIIEELDKAGPKLILLEAAAGFGKTSTAFEICNYIATDPGRPLVMLAELSRDRKAKIFRHILLEEIDRSFPSLSSGLVEEEIKYGNIVVVLDGFDELLRGSKEENEFEHSEAMLETIAKLLRGDAKIILTTRKTAILEGEGFYNWADSHQSHFETVRISLLEPRIRDWLGGSRITDLENAGISLPNISNPVLLSYLNFMSDEGFSETLNNPESIHDRYFNAMLERETERQKLHMSAELQGGLLTRLAADMVSRNYTKDFRSEITKYLIENELSLLEDTRAKYSADERPEIEELAIKLSNHAFLDRISSDDRIGFINDFVLGSYVGKSILEFVGNEWVGEELFIEVSVEAFASKPKEIRLELWSKLGWVIDAISDQNRISFESRLLAEVLGSYRDSTVNDTLFEGVELFSRGQVQGATLCNCVFRQCVIHADNIFSCCFVDCSFYECKVVRTRDVDFPSTFLGCQGDFHEVVSVLTGTAEREEVADAENYVWKYIFEKFWPVGKETMTFAHRPLAIFYGKNDRDITPEAVAAGIDELRRQGYLIPANKKSWIGLNISRLGEIAGFLGKQNEL